MNTAPAVGDRVRFVGRWARNTSGKPFVATVVELKPTWVYNELDHRDEEAVDAIVHGPEPEWRVRISVDPRPRWWPYVGNTVWVQVKELEPLARVVCNNT